MTEDCRLERAKALHRDGRRAEAEALYRAVLEDDAANVKALNNLGTVLEDGGRLEEALTIYGEAAALAPEVAVIAFNRGHVLQRLDRVEAAAAYRRAIALEPTMIEAYRNLSHFLYGAGRLEEAAEVLRRWTMLEPDSDVARHALAAATGYGVPPRAADGYVVEVFDRFADDYDAKMARLGYRAPALISDALGRLGGGDDAGLSVLDAGCGTGLLAPVLRPRARTLAGVDLSRRMLAKAEAQGLYDRLVEGELTAFLAGQPCVFDLVASADTLIYFGDLAPVLGAAAGALAPGGVLLFTVESLEEGGKAFRLNPNGRYAHSAAYVEAALRRAGLAMLELEAGTLRFEGGAAVSGYVVTARR